MNWKFLWVWFKELYIRTGQSILTTILVMLAFHAVLRLNNIQYDYTIEQLSVWIPIHFSMFAAVDLYFFGRTRYELNQKLKLIKQAAKEYYSKQETTNEVGEHEQRIR